MKLVVYASSDRHRHRFHGQDELGESSTEPGCACGCPPERLYVAFPAIADDRVQIHSSYSADKGKTWSQPVIVNDDRSPEKGGIGPDHVLPAIGVNKDGVVLIAWYDRREAADNLGWRLRAAVSLDGGETYSASVPITDAVNAYTATTPWTLDAQGWGETRSTVTLMVELTRFFTSGGHTTGLAVDADGTFHPTWISDARYWTSSIRVDGVAVKNGSTDLSALDDVSKSVTLELSNASLDRRNGALSMTARLRNTSKETIEGPVKVRVLTLESELGVPEITNADNGEHGTGAVWDFSDTLSGPLLPAQTSSPKMVTFRMADIRPLTAGRAYKNGLLHVETRVYGNIRPTGMN